MNKIEMTSPALSSPAAARIGIQRTHLDYLFTGFLQYEWLLALTVTVWLSRENGISVSTALRHQFATLFLGALLALVPALLVWRAPDDPPHAAPSPPRNCCSPAS